MLATILQLLIVWYGGKLCISLWVLGWKIMTCDTNVYERNRHLARLIRKGGAIHDESGAIQEGLCIEYQKDGTPTLKPTYRLSDQALKELFFKQK